MDRVRALFTPPYIGPFRVIRKKRATIIVQVGERQEEEAVERLKAARLEQRSAVTPLSPTRTPNPPTPAAETQPAPSSPAPAKKVTFAKPTSRMGRIIKLPAKYQS